MKDPALLAIVAKAPRVAVAKTRLGREVGMAAAAALAEAMLRDLVCSLYPAFRIRIWTDVPSQLADELAKLPSFGVDVVGEAPLRGKKSTLLRLFKEYLLRFERVVAVFGDVPGLDPNLIERAFATIDERGLVVGPDLGVGYYLIGMNQVYDVFTCLPPGRGSYFKETVALSRGLGLRPGILESRGDVDRLEDFCNLEWNKDGLASRWLHTSSLLRELGLGEHCGLC